MSGQPRYLRSLRIVFMALTAGQIIFMTIAIVLLEFMERDVVEELGSMMLPLALLLSAGSIAAGHLLFRRKTEAISAEGDLSKKLVDYRSALIIRFALFETPTILCTVFYLVSGNSWLIALAGGSLLHFVFHAPGEKKLIKDLRLDYKDQFALEKEN